MMFQYGQLLIILNGNEVIRELNDNDTTNKKNNLSDLINLGIIFSEKFGLFAVNMLSPNRERIPKMSSEFMRSVVSSRIIPDI